MSGRYDSILHASRTYSPKHPPIPNGERAAQFAPFAALSGYEEAVEETARRTQSRVELSEEEKARLDAKLRRLLALLPEGPEVSVCYFVPDKRKAGGAYRTWTGRVRRVDAYAGALCFRDGPEVALEDIRELWGDSLEEREDTAEG